MLTHFDTVRCSSLLFTSLKNSLAAILWLWLVTRMAKPPAAASTPRITPGSQSWALRTTSATMRTLSTRWSLLEQRVLYCIASNHVEVKQLSALTLFTLLVMCFALFSSVLSPVCRTWLPGWQWAFYTYPTQRISPTQQHPALPWASSSGPSTFMTRIPHWRPKARSSLGRTNVAMSTSSNGPLR